MADSRQPGSPHVNIRTAFPLHLLPMMARQEIAKYFDGDMNRFYILAHHLGFTDVDWVMSTWTRGIQGVQNSGTLKLLDEFQQRQGTVQRLYGALCQMNHCAAYVILEWRTYMREAYCMWVRSRNVAFSSGQQNSCCCESCTQHFFSRQSCNQSQSGPSGHQYEGLVSVPEPLQGCSHPQINSNRHRMYNQQSYVSCSKNGERSQARAPSVHPTGSTPEGRSKARCSCDKCRLASDPHETQLLTYHTTDKQEECLITHMSNIVLSQRPENNEGSTGVNGGSEELKTDKLGKHSSNTQKENDKLCANSRQVRHFIGNMPDTCNVCKKYISETKRYTWDGSQHLPHPSLLRDSSSDGSLNTPHASVEVIYNRLNILHSVDAIGEPSNPEFPQHQNIQNSRSANNSKTNYSSNNSTPPSPPSPTHPPQANGGVHEVEKKLTVLISYSPHSPLHLEEIKKLIYWLQQADVRVKIDMDPGSFKELGLNRNEWLDRSMNNADFIIICVSPLYFLDVYTSQDVNSASPRISQLNTRYIHDRLRSEYIKNQSQNRRMIPVLFPRSGANPNLHLPPIMQATLVYTFPDQMDKIIDRIVGNETALPYV